MKMKHDNFTAQGIKISIDPRKYKPTNSLCYGYSRNFKPLKLNTLTVVDLTHTLHVFIS